MPEGFLNPLRHFAYIKFCEIPSAIRCGGLREIFYDASKRISRQSQRRQMPVTKKTMQYMLSLNTDQSCEAVSSAWLQTLVLNHSSSTPFYLQDLLSA